MVVELHHSRMEKPTLVGAAKVCVFARILPRVGQEIPIEQASAKMVTLDRIDEKILSCLQEDATMPLAEIAKRAGLSSSPCWRRIQRLEENGTIRKRVALLDPQKVGV